MYSSRLWRRVPLPVLEGKDGFEPTSSRCAAGVLPATPLAHIAGLSQLVTRPANTPPVSQRPRSIDTCLLCQQLRRS